MESGETSFNSVQGTIQDSQTPLTPFYTNNNGEFWSSNMAKSTEAFGYSYQDLGAPFTSLLTKQNLLARNVALWYGGHAPAVRLSKLSDNTKRPLRRETWKRDTMSFQPNVKINAMDPPSSLVISQGRYTEWIANVKVNTEALDGRFDIHFFLGEPPNNTQSWDIAQNQIGTVGIFAMNRSTGSKAQICGTLPLTSALLKMVAAGEIPHLGLHAVNSFLSQTLRFGILGSNDMEVKPCAVEGLSIEIASMEVQLPDGGSILPRFQAAEVRLELWASTSSQVACR